VGSPTAFYIGAIYSGSYSRLLFIRFLRNFASFIAYPEATQKHSPGSGTGWFLDCVTKGEVSVKFIRNTFIQTAYVGSGVSWIHFIYLNWYYNESDGTLVILVVNEFNQRTFFESIENDQ